MLAEELVREERLVFSLNTGTNAEESNPLEMSNWEFYVVPTAVINDTCVPDQKTISLGKGYRLYGTHVSSDKVKVCP